LTLLLIFVCCVYGGVHLTDGTTISFPITQVCKMVEGHLSFEQRKLILKWYWRFKNVLEVQRQWTHEFETMSPT